MLMPGLPVLHLLLSLLCCWLIPLFDRLVKCIVDMFKQGARAVDQPRCSSALIALLYSTVMGTPFETTLLVCNLRVLFGMDFVPSIY